MKEVAPKDFHASNKSFKFSRPHPNHNTCLENVFTVTTTDPRLTYHAVPHIPPTTSRRSFRMPRHSQMIHAKLQDIYKALGLELDHLQNEDIDATSSGYPLGFIVFKLVRRLCLLVLAKLQDRDPAWIISGPPPES